MADMKFDKTSVCLFLGGLVLGKYGKEIFGSEKAREVYVKGTVLGLKAKDSIAEGKEVLTANAQDILEEAKALKAQEELAGDVEIEEIFEDESNLDSFTEEL